jgi:hypothetical protein
VWDGAEQGGGVVGIGVGWGGAGWDGARVGGAGWNGAGQDGEGTGWEREQLAFWPLLKVKCSFLLVKIWTTGEPSPL